MYGGAVGAHFYHLEQDELKRLSGCIHLVHTHLRSKGYDIGRRLQAISLRSVH